MNALSLFSSAGIGEYYLNEVGINVVVANEIVASRAETHLQLYPKCRMVNEDIVRQETKQNIIKECKEKNIELVIATPLAKGLARLGRTNLRRQYSQTQEIFLSFQLWTLLMN